MDKIKEYTPRATKHLHTLSAAFPPFLLRIRNYRSETMNSTINVADKILNQKNIENLFMWVFPTKKKSRRSL